MGADGHRTDPLSTLTYSVDGMVEAVRRGQARVPGLPILLGGAGGYQPDDVTPEVWARMALVAAVDSGAALGSAWDHPRNVKAAGVEANDVR